MHQIIFAFSYFTINDFILDYFLDKRKSLYSNFLYNFKVNRKWKNEKCFILIWIKLINGVFIVSWPFVIRKLMAWKGQLCWLHKFTDLWFCCFKLCCFAWISALKERKTREREKNMATEKGAKGVNRMFKTMAWNKERKRERCNKFWSPKNYVAVEKKCKKARKRFNRKLFLSKLLQRKVSYLLMLESVDQCSVKKLFLEISQNLQKTPDPCNFIKKETMAQVFSCEFYEISKNIFSYRTSLVAVSIICYNHINIYSPKFCKLFKNCMKGAMFYDTSS